MRKWYTRRPTKIHEEIDGRNESGWDGGGNRFQSTVSTTLKSGIDNLDEEKTSNEAYSKKYLARQAGIRKNIWRGEPVFEKISDKEKFYKKEATRIEY